MKDSLDSVTVRRALLRNGGRIRETARQLECSPTNVLYHLRAANQAHPLTHGRASREDQDAINAYLIASMDRLGIRPRAD
jgi:hypothetical protein